MGKALAVEGGEIGTAACRLRPPESAVGEGAAAAAVGFQERLELGGVALGITVRKAEPVRDAVAQASHAGPFRPKAMTIFK